jgi:hydrogenase maturation protease
MSAGESAKTLFIGVGNPHAGDDKAGRLVADLLLRENLSFVEVKQCLGDAAQLVELFEDYQTVYCCDAVRSDRPAGEIIRFEAHEKPLPVELFSLTTHDFGLPQAVELIRNMSLMPEKLIVYGISAQNFQPGSDLTGPVQKAVKKLANRLSKELKTTKIQ